MAKIDYQNPAEKQKLSKRAVLLKKFAQILGDRLSRFEVKAVCLDNGREIQKIKIELSKKHSSEEDVVKIKKIIIETGNFTIFPKLEEGFLSVSINLEKIDSFGKSPVKEVIVPLLERKIPVGLEKDLSIKRPLRIPEQVQPKTVIEKISLEEKSEDTKAVDVEIPVQSIDDICERVQAILKSWGYKIPKHYSSVQRNKIGATIYCTSEGIEEIKEKFISTYSSDKAWGKDGKKTVKIREDFDANTSLPKEPVISKAGSWAETFANSEEEKSLVKINESTSTPVENGSLHRNIFEPISLTDTNEKSQQSQIQTIQNKEIMTKKEETELKGRIKSFLKSIGLNSQDYYQITPTNDNHLDLYLRNPKNSKKFEGLKDVIVEERHIFFSTDFIWGGGTKPLVSIKEKAPIKERTSVKEKSEDVDDLENLFDKIRALKSGPDLAGASAKFEEAFPGKTLWLQDGESSKKISIEVLLKKIFK